MNAAELREAIGAVAEWAATQEPTNINDRARIFVAGLSGRIEKRDPELSALIWGVLYPPDGNTTAAALTASAS